MNASNTRATREPRTAAGGAVDATLLRAAKALRGIPEHQGLALALVLTVVVGIADYATGAHVTMSLFFLVPVAIATWSCRATFALCTALLAGLTGLVATMANPDQATLLVIGANATTRTFFYLAFAYSGLLVRHLVDMLERQANHDELTGLLTRPAFYQAVEVDRQRTARNHQPISLLYLDLDNLKVVNDEYGHEGGDELLSTSATRIRASLRPGDWAARLGGDEFAVCLTNTDAAAARAVVERIQGALAEPMATGRQPSASIGCATFSTMPRDVEAMVHAADQLMYAAKRDQRGSACFAVLPAARS